MIGHLSGTVLFIQGATVTIDVHGVGYEVRCTEKCRSSLSVGSTARVITYHEVREDGVFLYGFADLVERQVFALLLCVKGVGARTASEILSSIDARDLLRRIGAQDVASLKSIKGIGQKTAERIVLELKDKVASYVLESSSPQSANGGEGGMHEALEALIALGFSRVDGERALTAARSQPDFSPSYSTGDIVRVALRHV